MENNFIHVEEAKTDSEGMYNLLNIINFVGNFRIRALNPEETYIIKLK